MTVIRNVEGDLWRFRSRAVLVSLFILFLFVVLLARLFYLQIVRYDEFRLKAESNRTAVLPIVPSRGVILDRNGVVLATNYSA